MVTTLSEHSCRLAELSYLSNGDIYQTEREQIFNQYFKYSDIHNSERIVDTVTNYLNTYS